MANSPSHRFGQIIGDLLEESMVKCLIPIADEYGLYLDHKHQREARGKQREVVWKDIDGNKHKLDIVLENGGSENQFGTPRAFIEVAWRRYTKHSKNKAQEIAGAIRPLVDRYRNSSPFYGAVIAGVFTDNSIQQLVSEGFSVVYFTYDAMAEVFDRNGIDIRWDESTPDSILQEKVEAYESLPSTSKKKIIDDLLEVNKTQIENFIKELKDSLNRTISSIYILPLFGTGMVFSDADSATEFIRSFKETAQNNEFIRYDIVVKYSNGDKLEASYSKKSEALAFLRTISQDNRRVGQMMFD